MHPIQFGFLHKIIGAYKHNGGFQLWDHTTHNKYRCRGPFIEDWGAGAAKWHPSVHGHKLRAAHHAYFWLAALKDAALEVKAQVSKDVPNFSIGEYLKGKGA